uniref:Uncharacterized protein n=1 Tax=Clytia hemisphaerica TaxID=252671 RepID=A0A7M5XM44_9CNID|eukprot:TCONS_00035314-protein
MVLYKKKQENEWKMKMKDLENEHKIKILQTETKLNEMEKEMTEKEATVQHLNREIENLKSVIQKQNKAANEVVENMTTIDRLVWGAEYKFTKEINLHFCTLLMVTGTKRFLR